MKIKYIAFCSPSIIGSAIHYAVGVNGVTEIKRCQKNGEYCFIDYFEIYVDGKLKHELHHYSHLTYEEGDTQ